MRVLIHGYLGFKNLGDELILAKVIEDILSVAGDMQITVVTINEEYTRKIHSVQGVVSRTSPDAVWEAVKESDVIVVGGGGLIQEYNDIALPDFFKSFGYGIVSYAIVPFMAKVLRKPVFYWGHGVGPIFTEEGENFTRWFYSLADFTTIRDTSSLALLKKIYPEVKNAYLDADPVLALDVGKFIKGEPPHFAQGRIQIGLNLRPWFGTEDIIEKVSSAIQDLSRERKDFVVVPIPFDSSMDSKPLQKVLALLPEDIVFQYDFEKLETPEDVISRMKELDFFIGMRLHASIVARSLNIPSLSISYDVKTDDFSKKAGMEFVRVGELTKHSFLTRLRHLQSIDRGKLHRLDFTYRTPEFFRDFLQGKAFARVDEKAGQEFSSSEESEGLILKNFITSLRAEIRELKKNFNSERDSLATRLHEIVSQKDSAIAQKEQQISDLLSEKEALAGQFNRLTAEKGDLVRQLNEIYSSNFWRAASLYYKIRKNTVFLRYPFKIFGGRKRKSVAKGTVDPEIEHEKLLQGIRPALSAEGYRNLNKYDVIFFSIINWHFRFQRPQQIATRFANNGHRVFYLSGDLKRQSAYKASRISENIYEITLPYIEDTAIYNVDLFQGIRVLRDAVKSIFEDFRIKESVTFVEFPLWYPLVRYLKEAYGTKILFDYLDEFSGFGNVRGDIKQVEEDLFKSSDFCLATATKLYEKAKENCGKAALVRNGTDFGHFSKLPVNDLLKHIQKPIIGYYGAIAEWFETDIIEYMAAQRPQWSFILIGHTFGSDIHRLKKYRNVHLLGEKPYAELPKFLYWFDVGIIPFKINELTLSTNPVKFYEFMSSGKPVVSTGLPELSPYSNLLYLADSKEDFLKKTECALEEKDDVLVRRRIELARESDWNGRFREIHDTVKSVYPLVSAIVVSYNNLTYTRLCVESLFTKTAYPNYELIVVDNASTDGTRDYLSRLDRFHPNVTVILNDQNLGFAAANNTGIQASKGEYIIFLNNDTVLTGGLIHGLVRYLENKEIGMVGPVTNNIFNEAKVEVTYTSLEEMDDFAERYTRMHKGQSFEIPTLALYCAAIRKEVIDEIGMFDEGYEVGMFEDDDYCLALRRKGYRVICARDQFIHHFGQASFSRLKNEEYLKIFQKNRKRYEEKWGVMWEPHVHNAKGDDLKVGSLIQKSAKKFLPASIQRGLKPYSQKLLGRGKKDKNQENEGNYTAYQARLKADFEKNRYGDFVTGFLKEKNYEAIIFYPSLVEWDIPLFQRPHQIFRELSDRGYLVLFLTPNPEADKADPIRQIGERLFILRDIDMMHPLREMPFLTWISWTPNKICKQLFPKCRIVYDFIDELEVFGYYCRSMEIDHDYLIRTSNVVITTAQNLYAKVQKVRPDVWLIPNGVRPEDFAFESDQTPKDFEPIMAQGKPVVGYYGALAKWLDYELIHFVSEACRDLNFVFIGPKLDSSAENLQPASNVFFFGPKKYEDLKYYLRCFDVAVIPFQVNTVTDSTSPIKLFEYMAGGKPIVTTDMKECRRFQSVLIGKNRQEFVDNIRKALSLGQDRQYLEILRQEADENSWKKRVDAIIPLIK